MYHILIVDEEEHLLWALERNLFPNRDGIEVHTADSGEEGLEVLERESIDLLISDIKMPGQVDGFQLILRAKEKVPDARVMIITAFGTHRIENFAERIGISHYIEKPFTVDELRNAVLEILDEKEGFQGVLSDLELTDIIQMLCLAKRTALLHLKHRDHRGRIVFEAGEVVHAEFDGTVGAEAVYEMLALRQGDIFMQSDFESAERTIDIGWQDLLLEGVKRTDEQRMEDERERTRKKREETEDVEGNDEASKESKRTRTPVGMGAPSMASDTDDAPQEEAASGSMLFSEEELQEISQASEAAFEEEMTSTSDEDDAPAEAEAESGASDDDAAEQEFDGAGDEDSADVDTSRGDDAVEQEFDGAGDEDSADVDRSTVDTVAEQEFDGAGDEDSADVDRSTVDDDRANGEVSAEDSALVDERGEALKATTEFEGMGRLDSPAMTDGQGGGGVADGAAVTADGHRAPGTVVAGDGDTAASDAEALDEERSVQRQRSGTSPGMAAVASGDETSHESAERDEFAAPALNGEAEVASVSDSSTSPSGEAWAQEAVAASLDDEEVEASLREFVRECPGLKVTAIVEIVEANPIHCSLVHLEGDGELEASNVASSVTNLFSRAERSVTALQDDDGLRELQLVLPEDYLLMRALDDSQAIHVALVDREVSLGIALVLMRQFDYRSDEDANS